jgi:hypothetical protein
MQSKNQKQTDGAERNAAWRALSPQAQLHALDGRLGVGKGAARQRAKLLDMIHNRTPAPAVAVVQEVRHEIHQPVASKAEGRRRDAFKKKAQAK